MKKILLLSVMFLGGNYFAMEHDDSMKSEMIIEKTVIVLDANSQNTSDFDHAHFPAAY